MKLFFTILFVSIFISIKAQPKPSSSEIKWAIFHPIAAIKAKKITTQCLKIVDSCARYNCLDKYTYGGQLDAFRHGLWMAMLSQKMSAKKAIGLGKAHEKNNKKQFDKGIYPDNAIPDSASIAMDLLNNAIAVKIGKQNKKLTTNQLTVLLIEEIKQGNFYCIKRNTKGNFVDVLGSEIQISEQKLNWNNKKYLVKSNQ